MQPVRTKRKPRPKYSVTLKKLEAHLEHQRQLLDHTAQEAAAEQKAHEILADGYCQQVVLCDVVMPMQQQWFSPEPSTAQASVLEHWRRRDTGRQEVVQLVDDCNTMLRLLLRATPQQAREAAALTRDQLVAVHRDLVRELLLQLELLSPRRYRGEEIPALAAATGSRAAAVAAGGTAAGGAGAAAVAAGFAGKGAAPAVLAEQVREGLPGSCSPQLAAQGEEQRAAAAQAAAQARLEQLVHESLTLGLLLAIYNPPLLNEMCSLNLETQQLCVPPMGHFIRVTERLGLTEEQVSQMRLMLRRYNRRMQQQLQQGLQLLKDSEDSAGAAQQLIDRFDTSRQSSGSGKSGQTATDVGRPAADSRWQQRIASRRGRGSRPGSGHGEDSGQAQAPERDHNPAGMGSEGGADLAGPDLSDRMDQHLHHRVRLMQLMGFWVTNTLSARQVAKFFAHSWPYYPVPAAIAEASALLRPTAADPDTDADATDTQAFMAWRCRGMRAELRWMMQHAPELAGQAHTPHAQPEGAAAVWSVE